ncbi:glycosyltransferase family 2 protein [Myroides odoratimimus]|uniref:glycosyltransferase family 2 protein n=1 Tax=Myroides odoratimimus TaxID=76832 RepID=UPI00257581A3|nr:glycosyltransferase family 2 protein [Myroides odoratimimus]MDM1450402.1 glycosyltransferase family 2 protein [Myroides odoratimimus]
MIDISVIIPSYRPKFYIEECLESLWLQRCDLSRIEVIIVLNGDKEPYYEYISKIDGIDKLNVKILHVSENGVSNARNIGIHESLGKYVIFLDDDDFLSNNFLQKGLELISKNPEGVIIQSNSLSFKEGEKEVLYEDYVSKAVFNYKNSKDFSFLKAKSFFSSSCFKIIPKSILQNIDFDKSIKVSEDALFMFTISKNVKNIYVEKEMIYYRRCRNESVMNSKVNKIQYFINCKRFVTSITKIYFREVGQYNFLFYINRIAASFKFLVINFKK